MSLLLDTHVLLRLLQDDARLGPRAKAAVLNDQSRVSAVSIWEIAIRTSTGRLQAPDVDELLADAGFPSCRSPQRTPQRQARCRCTTASPSTGR